MLKRYAHIIKRHRPRGYSLYVRPMTANDGMTVFTRKITIDSNLEERAALFVFLHECGHVHNRHMPKHRVGKLPRWLEEYEADQYAIEAMRAEGIPVPRVQLESHKAVMREQYLQDARDRGEIIDDCVLKYAYGRKWRKFK